MDVAELEPSRLAEILPAVPRGRGLFAFNPPYGERMQTPDDVLPLYRDLGRALKRFDGWRAAVIVANDGFVEAFNARPSMAKPTVASGLRAQFLTFDLGRRSGRPARRA